MQTTDVRNDTRNADKLQSVISDDLFPNVQHISDVKQVIDVMKDTSQNLREEQIKALILLKSLGENDYLHGNKNPYDELYKYVVEQGKKDVADPNYYLETIEALIPKPPRHIVMAPGKEGGKR